MSSRDENLAADALRTAASAAAVGAVVGAARAISERRHAEPHEKAKPETAKKPEKQEKPRKKPQPQTETETDAKAQQQPAPEPERKPEKRRRPDPDTRREQAQPARGGAIGDLGGTVERAREVVRDLHGEEAESVSSVTRGEKGWVVGLEVVELRRIPDSTDVLATYEVEIDDDGGLVSFARGRRYRRTEAERGGAS